MPVFGSCDSCAPWLGVDGDMQSLAGSSGRGMLECEKLTPRKVAFYLGIRDGLFVSEITVAL